MQIVADNRTTLFTTLQLSNLSLQANVTNRKTAAAAYEMILMNTINGVVPFQIGVSPGIIVTPHLLTVQDEMQNCLSITQSATTVNVSNVSISTPLEIITTMVSTPTPVPVPSSANPEVSTATLEPFPTTSRPDPQSIPSVVPTLTVSCPVVPTPSPLILVVTTTTTQIVSPTLTCPGLSTAHPPCTHAPVCPDCPTSKAIIGEGFSNSHVIGIAFGMLILGAFLTLLAIVAIIVIYNKCHKKHPISMTEYHRHVDVQVNREYFQ